MARSSRSSRSPTLTPAEKAAAAVGDGTAVAAQVEEMIKSWPFPAFYGGAVKLTPNLKPEFYLGCLYLGYGEEDADAIRVTSMSVSKGRQGKVTLREGELAENVAALNSFVADVFATTRSKDADWRAYLGAFAASPGGTDLGAKILMEQRKAAPGAGAPLGGKFLDKYLGGNAPTRQVVARGGAAAARQRAEAAVEQAVAKGEDPLAAMRAAFGK